MSCSKPRNAPPSVDLYMSSNSADGPQLGTLIADGTLKLVEVLGVGGYGVVYRGVDTCFSKPKSYAVKCLLHSHLQPPARRQIHIREIALHQISSAHPSVITLHRVVDEGNHTYIIMDYAPDNDLFTQILNHCRYVGDDALIKHVFLQLLDAIEYCHSLGIYHRDLKPENILCFDDGYRVAITDFGLATTEKVSMELRTGSIYHMSPECHGGEFAPDGKYSPMSNDVWSLGIILLNLATGRNPWKTATPDDPTFQAYLRDPLGFFPSVLPVSSEINDVLVRMLHVDSRKRISLPEVREALAHVQSFYSEDVVFEGSLARCSWEAGLDIGSDPSGHEDYGDGLDWPDGGLKSAWSKDSGSHSSTYPLTPDGPGPTLFPVHDATKPENRPQDPSIFPYSSSPSFPYKDERIWTTVQPSTDSGKEETIDTPHVEDVTSGSSILEVSLDEGGLSSSFFPTAEDLDEQTGAAYPPAWMPSKKHISFASRSSSRSTSSSEQSCAISFARSSTPSSDTSRWSRDSQLECLPGSSIYTSRDRHDSKATIFNQFKFLRRSDLSSPKDQHPALSVFSASRESPTSTHTWFDTSLDRPSGPDSVQLDTGHHGSFGSRRRWFSLGKLFTSTAAS